MQWSMTRRLTVGSIGLTLVVLTSTVAYRAALAASAPGTTSALMGDFNLDRVVNIHDLSPFSHSIADPAWWVQEFDANHDTLVAIGDFDRDGDVTIADRYGFIALLQNAGRPRYMADRAPGALVRTSVGQIDLDIDSNNDSNCFLERDAEEE